jgi:hypothetical protein
MPKGSSRRSPNYLVSNTLSGVHPDVLSPEDGLSPFCFLAASPVIDPIQKLDEPLAIDPAENFLILWITEGKFLIAATENRPDVYPNLTFD